MSNHLYPHSINDHHLEPIVVETAQQFADSEGIELTRYYDYIESHCVHAFNGVKELDNGKWLSIRVIVFLDYNGHISAEVPRSRQRPFEYDTRSEATY